MPAAHHRERHFPWRQVYAGGAWKMYGVTFLPAEKDRPRRGPMWPFQAWADAHPVLTMLVTGSLVAVALTFAVRAVVETSGPDYLSMALWLFIAGRGAWPMWRQYERSKNW